jgi:HK97 family phage major capsid protein
VQVLRESNGAFSLLGRPLFVTEKLPVLGTAGDVLFVAPRQYTLGVRNRLQIDRSAHAGFANDLDSWRGIVRATGEPSWRTVYTAADGTTELSWAVVVEDR